MDIVISYDVGVKNWITLSRMALGETFSAGNITPIDFGLLAEDRRR